MKENNKEITNTNGNNKSGRECLVNDEKESARRSLEEEHPQQRDQPGHGSREGAALVSSESRENSSEA